MTFTINDHGAISTFTVETVDDLTTLADKYGWQRLKIDMFTLTIDIVAF